MAAVLTALGGVAELTSVQEGAPVQSALPYAEVEIGGESDWGHKSGAGRELRLSVTVRDAAERPERLRRIAAAAEAAVLGLGGELAGWRIVSLVLVRVRTAPTGKGAWVVVSDFRVRVLAAA